MSICNLKNITDSSQKEAYLLIFNDLAYGFLDDAHRIVLYKGIADKIPIKLCK